MISTSRYIRPLIFLIFPSFVVFSQSEVQFKALMQGHKDQKSTSVIEEKKIRTFSDYYRVDLNGDGFLEGVAVENSDLGSSIHFFKNHFEYFQELKVATGGTFSKIDRIEIKGISDRESVLLIYYVEGLSKYITSRSRQRLYTVYLPKNIFAQPFQLSKGPIIFEEYSKRGHYHVRKYDVSVVDLNSDGVKEILIKNKDIERVMKLGRNKNFELL